MEHANGADGIVAHIVTGRANEIITAGGAGDCPCSTMRDLAAGRYRLAWEDTVQVTDGAGCGLPAPQRRYGEALRDAGE